ncbi:JmjN domain-containing protein [Trichostrongylus colubriformis]|uniref:JmjN domain-containing protein n=1 Tax=Trichostrongylus colubriformis TaxID=6319 RepID=A0AAN8FV37_TRICO
MENIDRFYRYFERPPFAPVYYPTAEEFLDPLAYVAKIRPEAEQYGVVKIVPPESFKPPFAINSEKFEFTPRIQKLNEVEALVRERQVFFEKLTTFWNLQGFEFKNLMVDGKNVDLFKLYKVS